MSLAAGARLGRHEVVSVADDGSGSVYHAHDTHLRRDVAIKILPAGFSGDPIRRARFDHETHTIAQLNHPGICGLYDVGEQDGIRFLVMERVDGQSLEGRLRAGPVPWPAALAMGVQIADALAAAHHLGIVHRHLKPANVAITGTTVKLLDFGLAALVAAGDDNAQPPGARSTTEPPIVGDLHYVSPEQLEGRAVDARTDIFALGAVLYEMLTGRKAFDGEDTAGVTTAVMTTTPPPIVMPAKHGSRLPLSLDHVVQRALAKRQEDRWQTARDLRNELQWTLDSATRGSEPRGPAVRRRGLVTLALAGVVLLAAGLTIGVFARRTIGTARPLRLFPFTISPPDGTHLSPLDAIAVSPDGSMIAFIADENGKPSLWLRGLDDTEPSRIVGTESAGNPFWSPDGQSIGFFVDGGTRIKHLAVHSPWRVVAIKIGDESAAGGTAAWMADGTILFGGGRSGLYRVPASGGKPVLVAPVVDARGEARVSAPSPLGGERFFYLAGLEDPAHVIQGRIGGLSGPSWPLPPIRSNAMLAAGQLLFRDGTTLVAQPFDDRSLALTGRPRALVSNVDYDPSDGRSVFSASSTVLAYLTPVARKLTWFDRSRRLGPVGEEQDWDPVIVRDGSGTVAFDRRTGTRGSQIWTVDGQDRRVMLSHGSEDSGPVWSPDGQWVAYVRTTARGAALYRAAVADSRTEELLADVPAQAVPVDWSWDSGLIYSLDRDLWVYSLSTRTSQRLTSLGTVDRAARVSPDGRWLAYSVSSGAESSLWVKSMSVGTAQPVGVDDGFDPAWREDGHELYFMTHAGQLMAMTVGGEAVLTFGGPVKLFAIDPAGIPSPLHVFAATADGKRFLVSEPAGREPGITVVVNWSLLLR